ncbi:ATP-binding protein [Achromobacter seleniivolatilans]|uniref:histidine kinase n=1 Tax=Achromobacter seleniivolatilans TaxID=3047478 RepID=A0ABY9M676_9BURK|nr:ATP-binding protein [Achromobacter sp. R39]WMD22501.1 ATP-binding protein [Achromobacter sp. R39]
MTTFESRLKALAPVSARYPGIAALAPIAAIVLIVLLLGLLLNVITTERRNLLSEKALRDTLWVAQTLQFQLSSHEDNLQRLAADLGETQEAGLDDIFKRAKQLVRNNPEIVRIVLRDDRGAVLRAYPGSGEPLSQRPELARTLVQARRGNSVWSESERAINGITISFATPVVGERGSANRSLEVTVQLDSLLGTHVPWWLAERYSVQLQSLGGDVLASKSVSSADKSSGIEHTMSFSPPANGALLTVSAHGDDINFLELALVLIMVGLASLTIVNLWLQSRYARRRTQAENALREEQAFRKAMEDAVTIGLRARDLEGKTLYVNAAYCRMVGWTREEILASGTPMPWWDPRLVSRTLERHREQTINPQPQSFETRFRHRSGIEIDVLVYEAPLRDARGKHVGWIGSMVDVSDRKRAEAEASRQADKLQQTGRLILMGEMASTMAHELNQPLGAITSYAAGCTNMLSAPATDQEAVLVALDNLRRQACRAGEIIRRIHDFVRKREPVREVCNLSEIVCETVSFARADALRHSVSIELDTPLHAVMVRADRIQIEQVALNLIRNAVEALQTTTAARLVTVKVSATATTAHVSVSDTGPGIDPDWIPKVFLPFETTKRNGMGMGLAICRSILESHQGQLSLSAGHTAGTTFQFSLPIEKCEALPHE